MQFSNDDKKLHKELLKLLQEGTFELKGKSTPAFIHIYNWTKDLGERFNKKSSSKKKSTTSKGDK